LLLLRKKKSNFDFQTFKKPHYWRKTSFALLMKFEPKSFPFLPT